MKFLDFVNATASTIDLNYNDSISEYEIDMNKYSCIPQLIDIIKPKLSRLDKIELPFIENAFNDINHIKSVFDNEQPVDDTIICIINKRLFGNKKVDELTTEQKNIIKVLTAYIVLQIN